MFTLLLPYIEQGNMVNTTNLTLSVIDPQELARSLRYEPRSLDAGQDMYACPSAPSRTLDYSSYFVAQGIPNLGPFVLGETDYAAVRGYHSNFKNSCAPLSPAPPSTGSGGDNGGFFGFKGVMTNGSLTIGKLRLTDVTDGLSNTIMFAEDARRHQTYAMGKTITPAAKSGDAGWQLNAAFTDYNTAIFIHGFDSTGTVVDGGCKRDQLQQRESVVLVPHGRRDDSPR